MAAADWNPLELQAQKRRRLRGADFPYVKDAAGNRLCRYCRIVVPPPRKWWCGDGCVRRFEELTNFSLVRARVAARDAGICAICRCDTEQLRRVLDAAASLAPRYYFQFFEQDRLLAAMGFNLSSSLWEADHIAEIAAGGSSDLSNLQTLCVPCHKQKTAAFAAIRAERKRKQQAPPAELRLTVA